MSAWKTAFITIERATASDAPAIGALLRAADLPHEDFEAHLENFLVARNSDALAGAVGFEHHGSDALLRSLVVAPESRGLSMGSRLVSTLITTARTQGVRRFFLLTTTAGAFFAKRGFRVVARESVPHAIAGTREFQSLCPSSAVCMMRELEAP